MRRALFVLLIAVVSGAALAAGAAAWLLYTEPGLAWMLARVERAAGSALQLNEVGGTLAGGVTVESARYLDGNTTFEARKLSVQVSPRSLFALAPRITLVRCEEILIATAPGGPPPRLPATLALPLPVSILDVQLARIVVKAGEAPFVITDMSFGYDFDAETHRLSALSLAVGGVKVGGNAAVLAVKPFSVEAAVALQSAAYPAARIEAKLSGTLDALRVAASTEAAGARSTLDAALALFEPRAIERLQVTLSDLDLHAFDPRLPRTSIRGGAALAGAAQALAGRLELENSLSGPHDRERLPLKSLRSAVRTDMTALQLSALNADLGPAGTLVGSATVALTRFTLSASARRLDLASLHGKLRKTRLNGRIDLAATMEAQSIDAALAEGELRLDISALRSKALVEVKHARARARGGEARASGRITLTGRQPFNLEGHFKGFDPAAWGDFPAGAISGRVSAKGTLKDRNIHADLKLEPSRLRGAPVAGAGSAEMIGERVAANLLIEIAGNRLEVSGAFGGHADTLSVALQAPRLAAIDPRLQGHLTATAEMTGTWQAPGAKLELSGKDLAYAEQWRATAVSARGVYSRSPDGPLELSVVAAGVTSPAWRVDRGSAEVKGTRLRHTIALVARGGTLDLTARAAGGWEAGRGWVGTVQELVNRGNVPVVLEAPFALEAGRERLRVGAVKAQVIGGRLDVRDARYESNRLTSEGRFDSIPARTALALAGLPADAGGTLRLSGAWSLAATPRWNGTLTVRHESGDVTLGAGNVLPLGLSALTLDARVIDDRVEYRGAIRAKLAIGNLEGSILPVNTADGLRITGASPLKLSAAAELTRLAALSGFTDATMRFDGRAKATFTAHGTLREPLFSGTLEADELSLAHPAEGVDLRGGALRAELAGREVRIRSFSIRGGDGNLTASGVLAQGAGRRAALDWHADRLTLLNRPDRRLIVTGKGNATLEGAKVALSGVVRADSGRIEISSSQLPTLGEDVVIVGRKRAAAERPGLRGVSLDLTLDFGDQFRLVGRGLDAAIAGRARVETNAVGELIAHGAVHTVRGVYHAFGQRLELERGRVIFDGPIENPSLDIRAMRKKQAVEAGVEVRGTARSPFVRVVSDPPLPEHEALSWLVLGRSSRDASAGDLGMLPLAAAALLNQDRPDAGIAGRLGLDSIGMRRDTVAGQIVTVGKRLTDDLYVIYEQGTGLATQALKLEYTLGQRWLVRAEAGATSAIGLFFRWAFD